MWYENSQFFNDLDEYDKQDIDPNLFQPSLKPDINVSSLSDLKWLLVTMSQVSYLGEIPTTVFEYARHRKIVNYRDFVDKYREYEPLFKVLELISLSNYSDALRLYGIIEVVKYIYDNNLLTYNSYTDMLVETNNLEGLKYVLSKGCNLSHITINIVLEKDKIEALKIIYDTGNFHFNEEFYRIVIKNSSEQCFYWLLDRYPCERRICDFTVFVNNLKFLLILVERGYTFDINTCYVAVEYDRDICLNYLLNHTNWSIEIFQRAAFYQSINCIILLHEMRYPWDETVCENAVISGNLNCVRYLIKNGCPTSVKCCNIAVERNNLTVLNELHTHNCPWDENTINIAIGYGNIDCLKYLIENWCPYDESIFEYANEFNNRSVISYLNKFKDYIYS